MFGIGNLLSNGSLNKRLESSKEREASSNKNSKRFHPAIDQMDQNQTFQALQTQLVEIQQNLATQNEIVATLSTNQKHQPHPNQRDSMADYLMKQFIKLPATVFNKVNPCKPTIAFDGSNWTEWEATLQPAFLSNKSFIGEKVLFSFMNLVQNQAVTSLMRNTLDSALLSIVEYSKVYSSKELFELLISKCKRLGRRHNLILVKRILKIASKSWLACFCAIISDIECAKISVDDLGVLLLQSLATAPVGADAKNFEYSIAQPLDDMPTVPNFGQVTTLSKVKTTGQPAPGSIPLDVKMSVQAI
jgi:hypothetical protein